MTAEAGEFAGLDRFEARKRVVARLEEEGRLVSTEKHVHNVGHCQRCDTVIEPYLSTQWFVKIQPLADPAIRAVEDGTVRFAPEAWAKTYFEWMRNIHDWCISRQLWWGHRIPAFTCENGHVTVADEDPSACATCGSGKLEQDPDVLDTWFSSQLWPFSVFGWPEQTPDLADFYPTDVLVTGYDILFFWVARMIMAGLRFTGKAPFHTVHLHGLVRVGGEKMSKTKGNVIDPLEAIEEFGADAVRFTLASAASSGPTVSVERGRMAGSRNFATKLWNAARFTLGQLEGKSVPEDLRGPRAVAAGPLDPVAPRRDGRGGQRAPRGLPVRRGGGRDLRVPLARALRRLPRDGQARAQRGRRGGRGVGARRAAPLPLGRAGAAASVHAVSDRGDLGEADRPAGHADRRAVSRGNGNVERRRGRVRRRGAARDRHARAQLPIGAGRFADGARGALDRSGIRPARR